MQKGQLDILIYQLGSVRETIKVIKEKEDYKTTITVLDIVDAMIENVEELLERVFNYTEE